MNANPSQYLKKENIHIQYLDCGNEGRSIAFGYKQGNELHVCRLDAKVTKIESWRGIFSLAEIPPLSEEFEWHMGDPHDEWLFSILCGSDPAAICDILCIPATDTHQVIPEIAKELPRIVEFLQKFVDQRAVTALSRSSGRNIDLLGFYSGDSERAVRRRQAAESYPIVANILASEIKTKIAIDRAKPLAPVLQEAIENRIGLEISKGMLKRLANAPTLPAGCSFATVARFSTLVPLDWIPNDGGQWDAFCHSAECLTAILGAPDSACSTLIKGRSGDWHRMLKKICIEGGYESEDIFETARNVMQTGRFMLKQFADQYILPVAAIHNTEEKFTVTPELRTVAMQGAFEFLFGDRGIMDVAQVIRRWSFNRNEIDESVRFAAQAAFDQKLGELEEDSWPPITKQVVSPSGIILMPLVTNKELDNEGLKGEDADGIAGLHHCIANYKSAAKRGDSHIVSIRKQLPDGKMQRLSTVEFGAVDPSIHKLRLKMHRGKRNSSPAIEARDALSWYKQSVAMQRIPINFDQIFAYQEKVLNGERPVDGLERLCGYDWKDKNIVSTVVKAWQPYMTEQWKNASMAEICGSHAVSQVADKILPDAYRTLSRVA